MAIILGESALKDFMNNIAAGRTAQEPTLATAPSAPATSVAAPKVQLS